MARIILLIAALICGMLLYKWIKQQPANKRWQYMMIIVGIVLLGLVATGKLPILFALIGALIPALQRILSLLAYLPMIRNIANTFSGNKPSSGQKSQVETESKSYAVPYLQQEVL